MPPLYSDVIPLDRQMADIGPVIVFSAIPVVSLVMLAILHAARRTDSAKPAERPIPRVPRALLAIHAASHLSVDMASAYAVMSLESGNPNTAAMYAAIYNVFAFGLQYAIGALADRRSARFSRVGVIASIVLMAATVMLPLTYLIPIHGLMSPMLLAMLTIPGAGIANAAFHAFAGKEVLDRSQNRPTHAGAFVCTGAAGLAIGIVMSETQDAISAIPTGLTACVATLVACAAAELLIRDIHDTSPAPKATTRRNCVICVLLATTVAARSLVGIRTATPDLGLWPVLSTGVVAVVLGKLAGGVLADRWGVQRTTIASLGGATALFALSPLSDLALIPATFLFNFTMPITMCMMADHMRGRAGTAFGVLSMALLAGYGAARLLQGVEAPGNLDLTMLSALSLGLMIWAFVIADDQTALRGETAC